MERTRSNVISLLKGRIRMGVTEEFTVGTFVKRYLISAMIVIGIPSHWLLESSRGIESGEACDAF